MAQLEEQCAELEIETEQSQKRAAQFELEMAEVPASLAASEVRSR